MLDALLLIFTPAAIGVTGIVVSRICLIVCPSVGPERRYRSKSLRISCIGMKFGWAMQVPWNRLPLKWPCSAFRAFHGTLKFSMIGFWTWSNVGRPRVLSFAEHLVLLCTNPNRGLLWDQHWRYHRSLWVATMMTLFSGNALLTQKYGNL